MENWFCNKISCSFKLFSARGEEVQRDFNVIAYSTIIVIRSKVGPVVITGMLVVAVKVLSQAVIAAVQKFKRNVTMLVRTDDSLSKTAPIREETGNDQKPDNHFFRH